MDKFIIELSNYYNWLPLYCQYVVFEYERFLNVANKNYRMRLIPSHDIEQCWQYHILHVEFYHEYCHKKFNRLILYSPIGTDIGVRERKIYECIRLYQNTYGTPTYNIVWHKSNGLRQCSHLDKNIIYIYIQNKRYEYSPILNETILTLKEIVSKKYGKHINNIMIYIENDQCCFNLHQLYRLYNYKYEKGYGYKDNKSLPDKISLLDLKFYAYTHLRAKYDIN